MGSESLRPKAEDFPTTHAPGDFLVSFASLQKKLAVRRRRNLFKGISPAGGQRPPLQNGGRRADGTACFYKMTCA